MTEVTVRYLGEEEWAEFKAIRLAALRDSPDAFVATADEEEGFDEAGAVWSAGLQFVASANQQVVGRRKLRVRL